MIILPNNFTIAIDGVSASGKGTIAKELSKYLDLPFLDTGKLYRLVAYLIIQNNINEDDNINIIDIASRLHEFCDIYSINHTLAKSLSTEKVGMLASRISTIKELRRNLLKIQRDFSMNNDKGAILDGRDIATVVLPSANYKIFVTADVTIRAHRRLKQLHEQGIYAILPKVLSDLINRDKKDMTRKEAPLAQDLSAVLIDTTDLTVDEIVQFLLKDIEQKYCSS